MFKIYNINCLYAILDNNDEYNICKLNDNCYVDIISNRVLNSIPYKKILPLSEFYPMNCRKKISKAKLVLKKYELNYYNHCKNNGTSIVNEYEKDIISFAIKKFINEKESLLEGHIFKSSNYIASYIQENYFLYDIDFIKIYSLVDNDEFRKLVDDHINKIVEKYINILFNKGIYEGEENSCYDDKLYDIHFRETLVESLSMLGIPEEKIEEKIEELFHIWRDKVMEFTYINRYHPIYKPSSERKISNSTHKEKWISYRKYEYYKQHGDSVVKYGNIEDDMLISNQDAESLKNYLDKIDKEREEYLKSLGYVKRK